jgi:hypothetical protein
MDPSRFDRFAQVLAERRSRRATVAGLLALAAGGFLGATTDPSVDARPSHRRPGHRRPCPHDPPCHRPPCRPHPCRFPDVCTPNCSFKNCGPDGCGGSCGSCVTGQTCQAGNCHGGGGTHCQPKCSGATPDCCGATCVDTLTDDANCGACGFRCPAGFKCGGTGACSEDRCRDDETRCDGKCTTLANDPNNCGFCGHVCPADRAGCLNAGCCTPNGRRCPASCAPGQGCGDCCGGICEDDGTCGATALPCFPDGHACPATCAPGGICYRCCSLTCLANGTCGTPPPPCQPDGAACPAGCAAGGACAGCCSGACGSGGSCGASSCLPYGGFCTTAAQCCNDVPCTAGRCRLP